MKKSLKTTLFMALMMVSQTALAQSGHHGKQADSAKQGQTAPSVDESLPMYLTSRVAMVVPVKASEDTMALGGGAGLISDDGSLFGLRVIWIPDPPPNALSNSTPKVTSAWGPVVEWQNLVVAKGRLNFFTNVAAGFVYGSPKKQPETPEPEAEKNVVLPVLELGLGLRVISRKIGQFRAFIAPELGYVLTGQSPYAAVSIGFY